MNYKLLFIPCAGNGFRPHFLQSDALLFVVVVLVMARILSIGILTPWPQNFLFADITRIDLVNLLNQNRKSLGLPALHDNPKLDEAAMLKAKDMVLHGYFAHQSPAGVTPWYWFGMAGYNYKYAGENLAVGFVDSDEVFNAWLNSPAHKANLHNPNYKDVGTAVLVGFDNNAILVVQEFGSLPSKPIATVAVDKKPAPTPAPAPAPAPNTQNLTPKVEVQVVSGTNSQTVDPVAKTEPKVLGQSVDFIQAAATRQSLDKGIYYHLMNFIATDYQNIILYFSYAMLLAVSVTFLINIFANVKVLQIAHLARPLLSIAMLYTATFVNQSVLLQLLPRIIKI